MGNKNVKDKKRFIKITERTEELEKQYMNLYIFGNSK